jgi:hypothetical protein
LARPIRLLRILISQFFYGDFFNSIGQKRRFGHVGGMSAHPPIAAAKRTSLDVAEGP